jgi:PAS domain S-box-containing protein
MPAAEKIKRLNRLYAVSSGINEAIVRVPVEQQLYLEACRIAVERGGFMMAWVGRNAPAQARLEPVARWGKDDGYVDAIHISTDSQRREGLGPGGTAFRTGQPAVCNDIDADHEFFAFRREALARGYRSCAAFPLKLEGRPVAVFMVYAAEPLYFDDNELALLTSLADNFSFAIEAREKDSRRARMEAALRASEARLRAVVDNEPECVKTLSPTCELLGINPAGLKMIEAPSLEAVLGRNAMDFIHPADRDAYFALHQRVCAGATGQLQVRALGMRGTVLWMDSHAVPLRDEDGTISSVLYVTRDVTRQRASLERLQHSQALLSMASRLGRMGAWEVDLSTMAVTWSDELSVILEMPAGYSPSFLEAIEFYATEHRAAATEAFWACARDGIPFDLELEIVNGRGRRLGVRSMGEAVRDSSGAICRVQGAIQDITDRRVAEEEIRQLAEQLTTTLESITDALVTVDRDWRFTYINHEAERVLRRSRAELLGTSMWDQFPEGRGTAFEEAYDRALNEGRTVELEAFYPPLDTWLEIRAYPSPQRGLTIYFRDIGERRAAQVEVMRLNSELEQRVRQRTAQLELANQELQAFSYSVAHDLRAPLAAIGGFGHALEKELGNAPSERAVHYLSRMREGAIRTSDMIDALLSLAQVTRTQLRWEPVDLTALAETAAQACREQSPGHDVACTVQPGLLVHGDPRLLALVMDNLLGNAWKFTAGQPRPEIEVGSQPGPEGETIFFVRDNGVGFDMAYANNLFGAFQRLHSQSEFGGSGIGLANVRRIVSRHTGRIWAHSQPDRGATFYFTLGTEPA